MTETERLRWLTAREYKNPVEIDGKWHALKTITGQASSSGYELHSDITGTCTVRVFAELAQALKALAEIKPAPPVVVMAEFRHHGWI